jgi:phosphoserine phosphatase
VPRLRALLCFIPALLLTIQVGCTATRNASDPLPSWRDGDTKLTILTFVEQAARPGSPDHVPAADRIAVFDNDGTLWAEQPAYFQLFFAMDRVRALAPRHPEWRTLQPFQAVIENDMDALAASGEHGTAELIMATHAGLTTDEFAAVVRAWINTARHPTTGRPYTEMVYQPMLELLDFMRDHGFKTYIVSGGGIEFMRVFAEEVYGIPPQQVIGSSIKTEFVMTDTGPVIRRLPEIDFIDDKAGKPLAINKHIGRRPLAAFGNSDGDLQMLQWTSSSEGPRLCVLIHHTDADREWAYDRASHIGRLDKALDEALARRWLVVDMARDWLSVFPDR